MEGLGDISFSDHANTVGRFDPEQIGSGSGYLRERSGVFKDGVAFGIGALVIPGVVAGPGRGRKQSCGRERRDLENDTGRTHVRTCGGTVVEAFHGGTDVERRLGRLQEIHILRHRGLRLWLSLWRKGKEPCARGEEEDGGNGTASVFVGVIERTMRLGTSFPMAAMVGLVAQRMELLLLPAVRVPTLQSIGTAVVVDVDDLGEIPICTLTSLVCHHVRLTTIILPVVRIHTLLTGMVGLVEWTPHCLEVEHVKVHVAVHLVQHVDLYVALRVAKAAELPVLAIGDIVGVGSAKLSLVLKGMIELLNAIVGVLTAIPVWTLLVIERIHTHIWDVVLSQCPTLILPCVVVVWTSFR